MKNFSLILLCLFLVFNISCNKDENNDSPSVSNTYSISLAGQINDENGQGIPNVTVQVGNKIDQTDGNGIYLIEKVSVNKSRAVVKATKAGYWNRSSGFIPRNSTVQYCNLVMPQKAAATSIQSSTGGSVTNAGATVVFPANAFVTATGLPYNGPVNITSKHLTTSDPNFGALIPGGDLMAEDSASNSVKLISYGMIGVELTDNNGNPLQLGPGIKANIQLPIASTQLASAPATIPLWYFDETKSLWIEEGIATKQGNNYVGQVEHFSWWNCDDPYPAATISGYVYDNYGNPIVNALIYYNYLGGVYTNQNGFYSGQVPSGFPSTIFATYLGDNSSILSIPALTAGQSYNVPNIIFISISFGKFKANFVDCNNQPMNTYVHFNGSTSNSFIYAPNGIVNTNIQCGSQTVTVYYSNTQFDTSFTQPCNPDSFDVGTIVLCDTTTTQGLSFSFNLTSPSNNLTYNNPQYFSGGYDSSSNQMYISALTNSPSQGLECYLFNFPNFTPGTYSLQNFPNGALDIEYDYGNNHFIIWTDSTTQNMSVSIIKNGAVGDTMEVMLSGDILIEDMTTNTVELGVLNSLYIKCIRTQ
ncbi:MAG: carboxypeptidase regulatory-like domain-containing protein [Bacteroidetes bacterium]|nr:carboxypeptidase regulatory-like domain-containing protein [Bacteroidota bacterium]